MADFSSIYDLPDKTASFSSNMMGGGSCGDDALFSPVYTKVDPNGCELLSLDDLSNSEFDYLNSDGTCGLYICLFIVKLYLD